MSSLQHLRIKMYKTVARQLHGVVPCWICGEHVMPEAATLEHIQARSEGGNSHADNLAISHESCNGQRHAAGRVPLSAVLAGQVQRRLPGSRASTASRVFQVAPGASVASVAQAEAVARVDA